jgi:hypothetical protein
MTLDDILQALTPFQSLRDIKHHRIPAPGLSFTVPNVVFLIGEVETTLLES